MATKYGIRTHYKDNTPGFRDSWDEDKWYNTKEQRDEAYDGLTATGNSSPSDILIEQEEADVYGGQLLESRHELIEE